MNHGSSQVEISEVGGQAAPVEFYVGNTTPDATDSIISEVLVRCAKGGLLFDSPWTMGDPSLWAMGGVNVFS